MLKNGQILRTERVIPAPASISRAAQHALQVLAHAPREPDEPPADDPAAWRRYIDARAVRVSERFPLPPENDVDVRTESIDGVVVHVARPRSMSPARGHLVLLDMHGGAFVYAGGPICRALGIALSRVVDATVWSVDYRMPPEHPYPTPLDDCVSAYRALLRDYAPAQIAVTGQSAGGTLATALLQRLGAEGLPMPAALVLRTPLTDLTTSGDTIETLHGIDPVLPKTLVEPLHLYAAGADLRDPLVSPLFGDIPPGWPPTLLQTGTRDTLMSDTVRLHRKLRAAGAHADLIVFEGMPHGGFFADTPEDAECDGEVKRFLDRHWPAT